MLAFSTVSEVFPECASACPAVMPDEVVDPLSGDPEPWITHDNLIWTELILESIDDELCQKAANLDA